MCVREREKIERGGGGKGGEKERRGGKRTVMEVVNEKRIKWKIN